MTKFAKTLFLLVSLLTGFFGGANSAWAWGHNHHHHRHSSVGLYIGTPFINPWYYRPSYPSYYEPSRVVVVPASPPPVYVEQYQYQPAPVAAAPIEPPQNYWYYCQRSQTYYPYVKNCPGGWQRVQPQP